MDHPITTLMLVLALVSLGGLAYSQMRVDIFSSLNTPKIYVFFDFIGMSPDQIEGFIVNELELYFQYVDDIKDIKSRNIQQVGLLGLGFFPDTQSTRTSSSSLHVQMRSTSKLATAVLRGNSATAVPILLALLCILSVFVPAFIMADLLRSLFMPLTLAVGFAMIAAYLLSSTFVPILCVALLKHRGVHGALAAPGCGHEAKINFTSLAESPAVRAIHPPVRTIVRVVGQPSLSMII